ncbi:SDR family oxidoreductase [Amycolatopsis nigrescens]|uniref:SDR family oxidoreductase n=1 Tax=Amycolatopsis nigrescens TaxID=381445 RepID=UPI00037A50EF|nr:SDR family oxidoreductase [Amycolatopsis nigrescens]
MRCYAGKKVVITGGTQGIGLAVARSLAAGGAEVLLTGRDERDVEAVRDELPVHVLRSDAASMADIHALGEAAEDRLGELDLLFVNAGHAEFEPLEAVTETVFDRTFDVTVKGAFFTAQRLAPLVRDGGAIVFSTAAPGPGSSVLSGALAAVAAFTGALAGELRRIRVNAVRPGLGCRRGDCGEIAAAVLFLGFDATLTTGSVLHADGGQGAPWPPR